MEWEEKEVFSEAPAYHNTSKRERLIRSAFSDDKFLQKVRVTGKRN